MIFFLYEKILRHIKLFLVFYCYAFKLLCQRFRIKKLSINLFVELLSIFCSTRWTGKINVPGCVRNIHPFFHDTAFVPGFFTMAVWVRPCTWCNTAISRLFARNAIFLGMYRLNHFFREIPCFFCNATSFRTFELMDVCCLCHQRANIFHMHRSN